MTTENIEDEDLVWGLCEGKVEMELSLREKGDIRIRVREAREDGIAWTDLVDYGFWDSRTKRGEIKNEIVSNTRYSETVISSDLRDVWREIRSSEEIQEKLLSATVKDLIENTVKVEVHQGDETEVHVYIEGTMGSTPIDEAQTQDSSIVKELVISSSEWVRETGDTRNPPLVERYSNAFHEVPYITWNHWSEVIRPAWAEMQVIVEDDVA